VKHTDKIYEMIRKRIEKLMGSKITFGKSLDIVAKKLLGKKFYGIYLENEIPFLTEFMPDEKGAIINSPINTHWIAMIRKNGKIHTFDSYGRKMGPNPVKVDDSIKQGNKKNEKDCGQRSLAYLYESLMM
jgi:hypothetical protein